MATVQDMSPRLYHPFCDDGVEEGSYTALEEEHDEHPGISRTNEMSADGRTWRWCLSSIP